jgi:hypothetical protein
MSRALKRLMALWGAIALMGTLATPAWGAPSDPLFVFTAPAGVPPGGGFNGPCGLAVDSVGNFYVSDYYHHTVDLFGPSPPSYKTQLANVDPQNGPCGLAVDTTGKLYVNNFHGGVVRYTPSAYPPAVGTSYGSEAAVDPASSTGVAIDSANNKVYVNHRTRIAVYDSSGAPAGEVGLSTLGDGYGVAISRFALTTGRVYVPDADTQTVKVYDPTISTVTPVASIAGPPGGFSSLVDSVVAVDNLNGDVYVADRVGSRLTAHPETKIDVFDSGGVYKGHLKYNVVDGAPVGLAVDNTVGANQGRVYVTSGNTTQASVYGYPPGAATMAADLPAAFTLGVATDGLGSGQVTSEIGGIACASACDAPMRAGLQVSLSATPDAGSTFAGWSGGGCSGTGPCVVAMDEALSLSARFDPVPPVAPLGSPGGSPSQTKRAAAASSKRRAKRNRTVGHRRHHTHRHHRSRR